MISEDQIIKFAQQFAIDKYTIVREYLQIVFLSLLYGKSASDRIYFKGGTSIRLLFQSGRFSEDLDFTADLPAKELNTVVDETIKSLKLIVPNIKLKDTTSNRFAYTSILSYKPADMKHPLNISLDFSLREKPETKQTTVLETNFPVTPLPVVQHMSWVEILAEKIRALLYRSKGRDVYDVWFMLQKGVELDWDMINRKTAFYQMTTSLDQVIDRLERYDDKIITKDLGKFLPARDRAFVAHLKSLALRELKARKNFVIAHSENIDYSRVPGGKNVIIDNLRATTIWAIERPDENALVVRMRGKNNEEATATLQARTHNGVLQLALIYQNAALFTGKSYDELINYTFTV